MYFPQFLYENLAPQSKREKTQYWATLTKVIFLHKLILSLGAHQTFLRKKRIFNLTNLKIKDIKKKKIKKIRRNKMWQTIFQPQTGPFMWTYIFNHLSLLKFSNDQIKYVYIDTCVNMYLHAHEVLAMAIANPNMCSFLLVVGFLLSYLLLFWSPLEFWRYFKLIKLPQWEGIFLLCIQ